MSSVIERLIVEHTRLTRVVRLLDTQSNLLTASTSPNIGLLVDALCYLTRFPDVTHHLLEDRIVDRLLAKKALNVEFGQEIEAQHAVLIRDGHDLLRDLEAATRGENMSQELVDSRIRIYAERLRHNMAIEELTLFPAALKGLDEEDWKAIDSVGLRREFDPLFDGEADSEFAGLYHVIMEEAVPGR